MAVYFEHSVQPVPVASEELVHTLAEWHSQYGLLAVACKDGSSGADGTVCFYHDQGELVEDSLIQRSVTVQRISWHPSKQVLAMGWRSGEVTLCNLKEDQVWEQSSCHHGPITLMHWAGAGTRLVTADRSGLLVIWRAADSSGQIKSTPLAQYKLGATPTHCVVLAPHDDEEEDEIRLLVAAEGWLYLVAEGDDTAQRHHRVAKSLHSMMLSNNQHLLVCLTHDMVLTVFRVSDLGVEEKISEAKLGGVNMVLDVIWAPRGVLATCSGEPVIRFWDCEGGENYILSLKDAAAAAGGDHDDEEDAVTAISYSNSQLAAGTTGGRVLVWHYTAPQQWELLVSLHCSQPVARLGWSDSRPLLAVNHESTIKILAATDVSHHMCGEVVAVQVKPSELLVSNSGSSLSISCDIQIRGVAVGKEYLSVWDGRKVSIYSHSKTFIRPAGGFNSDVKVLALYDQSIVMVQHDGGTSKLVIASFKGHTKHSLVLAADQDYEVVSIDVAGTYVTIATSNGVVWLVDLKRREPRLVSSVSVPATFPSFRMLLSSHSNSTGSHVSIVISMDGTTALCVWTIESNSLQLLDMPALIASDNEDIPSAHKYLSFPPDMPRDSYREQLRLAACIHDNRLAPISHCWAHNNMLIYHAAIDNTHTKLQSHNSPMVVSVFILSRGQVLIHMLHPLDHTHDKLIGCNLPHLFFTSKAGDTICHSMVRGFEGMMDDTTLSALLTFTRHSCAGNMDDAFRSIKTIRNPSVWESMAKMCVRTHRLDVAMMCLGNMGNAVAARAVRQSLSIPEEDARLAVLAVHLGMLDEAEHLYQTSGRYDLLNQFYQAAGKWQKAVEVAELYDRVHLKTTYYNLAKNSEAVGEIQVAINSYEHSDTHRFEVPRMLLEDSLELEAYVMKSKDKEVHKWWAEYLESVGDSEGALQHYETAEDHYSVVRVLHYTGHTDRAMELIDETNNRAAAYHVARQLSQETDMNSIKRAIKLFTMAQCYTPAIQLAKEHGFDSEVMGLALMGRQEDKIDAAQFYECNSDTLDKAILLYHRSGELSKALELCFQLQHYDVLQQIAEELTEDAGQDTVNMVTAFFIDHQQYDKAVQLLVRTGQLSDAVELCIAHNVPVTEELADSMTPVKRDEETEADTQVRMKLLERLADCCALQGAYHLATKKYTQAGNKIKAMQALIKSGDTEKIVFFAGVSRQRDIYVMAANYLQLLNWRDDVDIMKYIITFYTKGKAFESLASFYDTCAQMEIDKFQHYDKATGALSEAHKWLTKANSKNPSATLEDKMALLKQRISLVKRFADIRSEYGDNPEEGVRQCHQLLNEPHLDQAVRLGDVYALLIEHHTQTGDYKQAMALMDEMRETIPGVNMAFYLGRTTIEAVHKALAIPLGRGVGGKEEADGGGSDTSSVGEEVED